VKVLWFVNVPFPPVDQALPPGRPFAGSGWWMSALLNGIRQRGNINIHVAWGHDGEHHSIVHLDRSTTVEAFPFWHRSAPPRSGRAGNSRAEALHLFAARYPVGVDGVIERVAPHVIHVHGTEGPTGLLLRRWQVPTVVSIQGSPAAVATRYWGSHGIWTRIRHPRGVMNRMLLAARGRREAEILGAAASVAGRTHWDERLCRTHAPQAVYHRAFECIRSEFLSVRHTAPSNRQEQDVVVVSSAQPYKGVDLAISAIVRLRAAGRRVRLVVIGGCPAKGWGSEIQRAASIAGSAAVEMTGYLPALEIAQRLANADAFVLPSHVENSSNSLLEAMAVGVPCVASRVGGLPSMLRDGTEGLLFRRGDVDALVQRLDRLLADSDLASRLGRAAAERARATCKPEDITRSTVRMYEDLAGVDSGARQMAAFP
jgi:glycosyltransferase involved in cell wall biosynthesis